MQVTKNDTVVVLVDQIVRKSTSSSMLDSFQETFQRLIMLTR